MNFAKNIYFIESHRATAFVVSYGRLWLASCKAITLSVKIRSVKGDKIQVTKIITYRKSGIANDMENFHMFPNIFLSFNVINLGYFEISLVVFYYSNSSPKGSFKFSNTKLLNINILWPLSTHLIHIHKPLDTHPYVCVSGSYSMLSFKTSHGIWVKNIFIQSSHLTLKIMSY